MSSQIARPDPVVVEFGHPQAGGGYTEYQMPGREQAPGRFVEVAQRMHAMQPPTELSDTTGHSFWGLQVVDVPGHGQHLCFTVQGIGGGFGPSGGTQFVFTPTGVSHPAMFWWRCVSAIEPGGRVGLDFSRSTSAGRNEMASDPETDAGRLRQLFRALYDGEQYVTVQGTTDEVGQLLGRAFGNLPAGEIEGRSWWTCALDLNAVIRTRAVSGRWPAELRDSALQERFGPLDKRFRLGSDDGAPEPDPDPGSKAAREAQAIELLVSETLELHPGQFGPERPGESMADFVQHIIDYELALNVWAVIREGEGRDRLRKVLSSVREHARKEPLKAISTLVEVSPSTMGPILVRELLHGIADAPPSNDHRDGLAPPPCRVELRSWHPTLERALLIAFEGPDFGDTVWSLLMAPGRPLEDRLKREQAHQFLERLGFSWNSQPRMFPLPSRTIAEGVRADGRIDRAIWQRLAAADQPGAELITIARFLGSSGADAASWLLDHGGELHERGKLEMPLSTLMDEIAYAVRLPETDLVEWTRLTLERARDRRPGTRLAILRGTLARLDKRREEVPMELVRWHLALLSGDEDQPSAERRSWHRAVQELSSGPPVADSPGWGYVGLALAVVVITALIGRVLFDTGVALVAAGGTLALFALIMIWDGRNRSAQTVKTRRDR